MPLLLPSAIFRVVTDIAIAERTKCLPVFRVKQNCSAFMALQSHINLSFTEGFARRRVHIHRRGLSGKIRFVQSSAAADLFSQEPECQLQLLNIPFSFSLPPTRRSNQSISIHTGCLYQRTLPLATSSNLNLKYMYFTEKYFLK